MSTQQNIYAAGSENRPPMLNKDNYVPWSSRLLRYAKSKPNRNFLVNSIKNGPYTDDELTKKDVKKMEADDQAIQTIRMGLLKDIYVAVDNCDTTQEIWLRVEQMMKVLALGFRSRRLNFSMNGKGLPLLKENPLNRTIIDLHEVNYIQLYDFLKFNQVEVDAIRAERLARTHDPLALMANSHNPYSYLVFH
ncbi:hypothetical protein Tco_1289855 [Tanacetum coccineum]